jgi:hypothetical protein
VLEIAVLVTVGITTLVLVVALSLCKAAKAGDESMEHALDQTARGRLVQEQVAYHRGIRRRRHRREVVPDRYTPAQRL